MKKVLIIGAGSIGNHFANACRKLRYDTSITDISSKSLNLMKNEIFPKRYKKWDKKINIISHEDLKEHFKINMYDLVIIGTPPNTHLQIFNQIKNYKIKNILIEKPLCEYKQNENLFLQYQKNLKVFCGYNHSVSKSFNYFAKKIKNKKFHFIKVNWNESWRGILNAHFWMENEYDSYLGDYKIGGGALQEHSHGLHILLTVSKILKININQKKIKSLSMFKSNKKKKYDVLNLINYITKKISLFLEINLINNPPIKNVVCFSNKGMLEYVVNYKPGYDAVLDSSDPKSKIRMFKKERSSDFIDEIKHIFSIKTKQQYQLSPINLKYGIDTIKIINKIFTKK